MHEAPEVPNFGHPGHGPRLVAGMTLAIEPMVNAGTVRIYTDQENGWEVYTLDGEPSAQWEYQVAVTEDGVEVLAY